MTQFHHNEEEVRERKHPSDPNAVGDRYAAQIHSYRESILLFVKEMWGLEPQPVKPQYRAKWMEVQLSTGPNWLRLKDTVTAEWFGDVDYIGEYGETYWKWHQFEKGKHISWQQTLILMGIEKAVGDRRLSRHFSIKSGHGIGKSATVSWIVLWFLFCYYMSQVPVTAPTSGQMHDVLWKELAIWLARMPKDVREIFEWQHDYIRVRYEPESWFARAKTSTKENTEALAGVHAEHVFIAADEASGIPEQVFNTAEGALTSGNVFVILISNPTRVIGYFYDSQNKNAGDWQTFSFNCEQAPLVDRAYVERQAKRHKVASNEYKIRVKGEFPAEESMDDSGYLQLIPLNRIITVPVTTGDVFVGRKKLSVDPSGEGDDECEFVLRDRFRSRNIRTLHTTNAKEIAENIVTIAVQENLETGDIVVEGFGNGADIAKEVAVATKGKLNIYVVLPGNKPSDEEKINGEFFTRRYDEMDEDGDDLYLNLRALGHFRMRKWLLGGGVIEDPNPEQSEWAGQITSNKYKRTLQGNKIQMMPKKEQQKLRIPSPNKSDALMLSFLLENDEEIQTKSEREEVLRTRESIDDPYSVL